MEIVKTSIWDMLGSGSKKYHSCIATTFAFDFSFFEVRAMRSLKGAGVRNILVLVDEKVLEELTENPSGFEFRRNPKFGIYPIKASGVFHPKMIFCAGKNEGFLAIGSGNLTASGHGSNDELWSIFHFKGEQSLNAGIFSQTWNYIQSLMPQIEGNSAAKIIRMQQYAPWIESLPKTKKEDYLKLKDEQVSVRPVKEGDNIFSSLQEEIKKEDVTSINVLSPYYDKDGFFLSALERSFPGITINVILDKEFGLLPFNIKTSTINFYDWQKVKSIQENDNSRLHAKLIVFRMRNDSEFIFAGSSNATCAAIGLTEKKAQNKELNLFIKKPHSDIFKELKIHLSKEALIELPPPPENEIPSSFERKNLLKKPLQIKYAELDGAEIELKTEGSFAGKLTLHLFNRLGVFFAEVGIENLEQKRKIPLSGNHNIPFMVAFFDLNGQQISNKTIVQDTAVHNHGNPDPDTEKLEEIFDDIESGNFGLVVDLLRFVNFDSESDFTTSQSSSSKTNSNASSTKEVEHHKAESYDEFTHVSDEHLLKQKGLLHSPSLRIAEFLTLIRKKQMDFLSESTPTSEQTDNADDSEGAEDNDSGATFPQQSHDDCQKEKNAVRNFLKSYHKHLKDRTEYIDNAESRYQIKEEKVKVTDYSNLLIALQLVKNYTGKLLNSSGGGAPKKEFYLKTIGQHPHDNMKSFISETTGKFLLLAQQGEQSYEVENLVRKLAGFKKEAFFNIVFISCNLHWNSRDYTWIKVNLYNCLLNVLRGNNIDINFLKEELDEWIADTKKDGMYLTYKFNENYKIFCNYILPKIGSFVQLIPEKKWKTVKSDQLSEGDFIFNSKLGICMVKKVTNSKTPKHKKLLLEHPGFKRNERNNEWVRHETFRACVLV